LEDDMSQTQRNDGRIIPMVAPGGGVTTGVPVKIGTGLFGVPVDTAAAGARFGLQVSGVHALPKTAGASAYAAGDPCYWDGTVITKTATDSLIGRCETAALIGDTTVRVLINGLVEQAADLDAVAGALGVTAASAIAATNGGAGNAGKLFKADAAGKMAGRVVETDGAKLDAIKAIQQVTIVSGATTVSVALPAGWVNGDLVIATVAAKGANVASIVEAKCSGGNVVVSVNTDPGAGGCVINVLRTGL
jgi:predicted RecA/RadA family phage recombinase